MGSMRRTLALLALLALAGCRSAAPSYESSETATTCPVHHVALVEATVPLVYGLPSDEEITYLATTGKLFPYGQTYMLGGCILGEKKSTTVKQCPICVAKTEAWRQRHQPRS